jgi:anti-sigma factor ChrR (cupin superfamily)
LPLTDAGLRRIETAFVELEACHEQRAVEQEQLGNCREQLAAGAAIVERQGDSLAALHRALAAKDEILAKRETLHRAELRAARGSRLKRFGRALQYLGAGVVIGVVVAQ